MKVKMPQAIGKFGFKASDLARHKLFEHFGRPSVPWKFAKPVGSEVAAHCIVGGERLWGANTGPGSIRRVYSIDKSPALAGKMAAGALGVAVAGLSHCGHFQAKGAANRGKPLSAAAVDCAAAAASAASLARRRSALLDRGKPIVH